jgi:hypothetical protein
MREFHAIVSVTAVDREQADAFFERIERDALRFGGNLTCLDSVHPDTGGEPHPRLEVVAGDLMRATRPGETRAGGPAPGDHDYVPLHDECTCGAHGAIDGHAYYCNLRRGV